MILSNGHISEIKINKLYKEEFFDPYDYELLGTCESCLMGKMTKTPFSGHGERISELLGLVHTDVCGPVTTEARGGYSYFITFTDYLSRFGYIYLMKHKLKPLINLKSIKVWSRNKLEKILKSFDLIEEKNTYPISF